MNFVADEFICSAEELGSDQYNRSGSISDLFVLLRSERDKDSCLTSEKARVLIHVQIFASTTDLQQDGLLRVETRW